MTSVLGSGRASGGPSGQLKCKPKRRRRRRSKRKGKGDLCCLWFFFCLVCLFGCLFLPPAPRTRRSLSGDGAQRHPRGSPRGEPASGGEVSPHPPSLRNLYLGLRGTLRVPQPRCPAVEEQKAAPSPPAAGRRHAAPFWLFFTIFFKIRSAKFCYSGVRSASQANLC